MAISRRSCRGTAARLSAALLCLHAAFLYAQSSGVAFDLCGSAEKNATPPAYCTEDVLPPGGLWDAWLEFTLSYEGRGLFASAFGLVEERLCGSSCPVAPTNASPVCETLSCDYCAAIDGVETAQRCSLDQATLFVHKSFIATMAELWCAVLPRTTNRAPPHPCPQLSL